MNIFLNTNFPLDFISVDNIIVDFNFIQIINLDEIIYPSLNIKHPFIISINDDLNKLENYIHTFFDINYYFYQGFPVLITNELPNDDYLNQLSSICKAHGYNDIFVLYSNQTTALFKLNTDSHKLKIGHKINEVEEFLIYSRFALLSTSQDLHCLQELILKKFDKETVGEIIAEMKSIENLILHNQWLSLQLNNHKQYIEVIKNRYGSKFSLHFFINKNNKIIKILTRIGPLKIFVKSIFNIFKKILQ